MRHGKAERPHANQRIYWSGPVPHHKWMNFYTKVLEKYATSSALAIKVQVDVNPQGGFSPQQIEEFKAALRELGVD
jgi:hypothetical protein